MKIRLSWVFKYKATLGTLVASIDSQETEKVKGGRSMIINVTHPHHLTGEALGMQDMASCDLYQLIN